MSERWVINSLDEVAKINYGYTDSASSNKAGPKFLRITDIQDNKVDWDSVPYCKCNKADVPKHKLETGDIVFARTGATTGKSFLVTDPPLSVFASYLIRLRIKAEGLLIPEFVYLYFQTKEYWDNINAGVSGSAQGGFNASKLGKLQIPIPPLSEQKRIVAILDEAFAAIDKAKANIEKNLQNAKELFESYLGNVFNSPTPEWTSNSFGRCLKLKSGDGLTSKQMNNRGKYDVYGGNGIAGKHDKFNLKGENVIIGRVGALCGNARKINNEIWLTDNAFKVIDYENSFDAAFLAYLLNFKNLRLLARQAAQPVISNSSLKDLPLQFPKKIDEQIEIVRKFEEISMHTKQIQNNYQQQLNNLEELKKSILQKAFAGELTASLIETA